MHMRRAGWQLLLRFSSLGLLGVDLGNFNGLFECPMVAVGVQPQKFPVLQNKFRAGCACVRNHPNFYQLALDVLLRALVLPTDYVRRWER